MVCAFLDGRAAGVNKYLVNRWRNVNMSTTDNGSPPYVDPDDPYWPLSSPDNENSSDSFDYGVEQSLQLPEAFFDNSEAGLYPGGQSDIDPIASIVVPILFSLIFVVGIVGNSLQVGYVIFQNVMFWSLKAANSYVGLCIPHTFLLSS